MVRFAFIRLFLPFILDYCLFYRRWLVLINFVKLELKAGFHGRDFLFLNGVLWCLRRG